MKTSAWLWLLGGSACVFGGCVTAIPCKTSAECPETGQCDVSHKICVTAAKGDAGGGNSEDGGRSDGGLGDGDESDGDLSDGGPHSALRVTTETLAPSQVGTSYLEALSASGGSPPYGWQISLKPSSLAWLSVDQNAGVLSGVPSAAAPEGLEFIVAVTDLTAATATKRLMLKVAACQEGEIVACTAVSGASCLVGTQTCMNGQLTGICAGTPSSDVSKCGATCSACGDSADRCVGGGCQCGVSASCASPEVCCGGLCSRLDDARSCGSCSNDCVALAGGNVTATCAAGQCAFACSIDSGHSYRHCVGAQSAPPAAGVPCETDLESDVKNCGTCQHDCTPTTEAARATVVLTSLACASGKCTAECVSGSLDCNGEMADGCETEFSTANCGQCNNACTPGPHQLSPLCVDGQCRFSCEAGWGDCTDAPGCETNLMTDISNCGKCRWECDTRYGERCCTGKCSELGCGK